MNTYEDDEFNRIELEARMRMEAVKAAIQPKPCSNCGWVASSASSVLPVVGADRVQQKHSVPHPPQGGGTDACK